MNNDDKILKALEDLQADVKGLKQGQQALEGGQKAILADVNTIKGDVQALKGDAETLKDGQAHTNTILKTLATKQDVEVAVDAAKSELEAKILDVDAKVEGTKKELKADILMLDSKVVRRIQSHERRITNIEEHDDIENPEKN
jgi:hypothetical protein